MSLSKKDQELKMQIKEMFPKGTPDEFISNMFHSLRGKQMLWDCFSVNDSKSYVRKFTD